MRLFERVGSAACVVILIACSSSGQDSEPADTASSHGSATGHGGSGAATAQGGSGGGAMVGAGGSAAAGAPGKGGGSALGGSSGKDGAGKGGAGKGGASQGGSSGTSGSSGSSGSSSGSSGTAAGGAPTVGGCAMFPPNDDWNRDVSGENVDADWTVRLQKLVGSVKIHPDYGGDASELYGIPVGVVPATQPLLPVTFDWYEDESDPGPYPFPSPLDALIEGGDAMSCDGDCHLLVVQQGTCQLYEGYACHFDLGWHCGNGAHWDLTHLSYGQRPMGWTSADAAGLPIAPGIVRYDEVRAGAVNHAIRFTVDCSTGSYVKPATHDAVPDGCAADDPNAPPMGLRVRLRADYDISSLSESAQVVLTAMKRYGMILADNGSNFYFQGEANVGWTEDDIEPLKGVPASAFEVVAVPPLMN